MLVRLTIFAKFLTRIFLTLLGIFMLLNLGPQTWNSAGPWQYEVKIWPLIPDAVTFLLISVFSITFAGWLSIRTLKKEWAETIARLLLPLSIGFGLDILLLMVLTVVQPDLNVTWIRAFEEFAVCLRVRVHQFLDVALGPFLLILAVLLILTWLLPKWKLVTRFLFLQQCASTLFLVLMAFTTFSFFAEKPLQQRAIKNQEAIIREYQISLRKEWDAVGKYLAAKTMDAGAQQMDPNTRQQFAAIIQAISKVVRRAPDWPGPGTNVPLRVRYRNTNIDFEKATAQAIAQHDVQSLRDQSDVHALVYSSNLHEPPLPEERTLSTIPRTVDELRSQRRIVDEERSKADKFAEQAEAAFQAAVSAFLGGVAPELHGVVGDYVSSAVDVLGDLCSSAVESWSRKAGRHIPVEELLQRLKALMAAAGRTVKDLFIPGIRNNPQTPVNADSASVEDEVEKVARETVPAELVKDSAPKSEPDVHPAPVDDDLIRRRIRAMMDEEKIGER